MGDWLAAWGTLTVAAIALAQPWVIQFYNWRFKPRKIILDKAARIEVNFNASAGPFLGLKGIVFSENRRLECGSAVRIWGSSCPAKRCGACKARSRRCSAVREIHRQRLFHEEWKFTLTNADENRLKRNIPLNQPRRRKSRRSPAFQHSMSATAQMAPHCT